MPTKVLSGHSLVGAETNYKRPKNDFYATPRKSTEALLDIENFNGNVFEPCCGDGAISKVCKNYGYKTYSNDLVNRGYGETFKNFLTDDFPKYDNIITNPPFKYGKEFVEKSFKVARNKIAIFAKIQFLEGIKRYKMFKNYPPKRIHIFVKRQTPLWNGLKLNPKTHKKWASTMCFAWFVWIKGFHGKPQLDWVLN